MLCQLRIFIYLFASLIAGLSVLCISRNNGNIHICFIFTLRNHVLQNFRLHRGCVVNTRSNCRLQNNRLGFPCSQNVGLAFSDHPFSNDMSHNEFRCMEMFNKVNS